MVRVAVVTGGNKGIGLAIVRGLCARFDGEVYLTSRNEELGKKAVEELKKEGQNPRYHQLDITNKSTVEAFRDYIKEKYGGIDLLVNNAAIAFKMNSKEPVAVQAEQTIAVNYFAVLSTCETLFPILRNGARVVNVSSSFGLLKHLPGESLRGKLNDPNLTVEQLSELMESYVEAAKAGTQAAKWGKSSYSVSKVGVSALTRIHQKQLADRDIKVNAVHPGYVSTDMSSHRGLLNVNQGASAPLYLALDAPDHVRGQFVMADKQIVPWDGDIPSEVMFSIKCFLLRMFW